MRRLALLSLVAACAVPPAGAPSLASITPASGFTTEETAVRLQGVFHLALSADLDHGTTDIEQCSASIGTTPLANVAWRSEQLIEATVPAGMPLGVYDVTVTCGARVTTLPEAFTVLPEGLPTQPFGAPTLVAAIASPTSLEDDPSITADRLELFFNSDRPGSLGGADIYVTTRATPSDAWTTPVAVPVVNTAYSETTPKISADGLTLYFSSDRPGGTNANYDVWVSTRPSRTGAWSAPTWVPELSSVASDSGANPTSSMLALVLCSDRDGAGDLYVAKRAALGDPWGAPSALVEVNSAEGDADPTLAHGDRVIVFISARPGGLGGNDIYMATRSSAAAPFDTPVLLPELNSAMQEEDPYISDDLRYILFTSTRSGDFEIYEASR
ncbi:MAG TPA: hypothetical protein VMZ53_33260 [Kofleriaceae bacterium]|nr:hypothetical protein [Kofleriaceae bacterium]